jgi:hypothetical protein
MTCPIVASDGKILTMISPGTGSRWLAPMRSALAVISFAALAPQQKELATEIRYAVQRIEWALSHVFLGSVST